MANVVEASRCLPSTLKLVLNCYDILVFLT